MRGGKRAGSGRPKGSETKKRAEVALRATEAGLTPLEYMLGIVRDVTADAMTRLDAAKSAAPYCHPRLANVQVSGDPDNPLQAINTVEHVIVPATQSVGEAADSGTGDICTAH
jgi:hypothetical protein